MVKIIPTSRRVKKKGNLERIYVVVASRSRPHRATRKALTWHRKLEVASSIEPFPGAWPIAWRANMILFSANLRLLIFDRNQLAESCDRDTRRKRENTAEGIARRRLPDHIGMTTF